jgi:hypothetical protein
MIQSDHTRSGPSKPHANPRSESEVDDIGFGEIIASSPVDEKEAPLGQQQHDTP